MRINLLGINIDGLSVDELHGKIKDIVKKKQKKQVLNVNIHAMNIAHSDRMFSKILNNAEIVFCDGAGVRLGARLLGYKLPSRITYADWIYQLSAFCELNNFSLYLLGSKPGVAEIAASKLKERYPNLIINGCYDGYFEKEGIETDQVINEINQCNPNIVIVGFGMPAQEKWIAANASRINTNIFLSGGACFDYVAKKVPRAPKWMLQSGMEWLFRLIIEPKRMWRRYIIGNIIFMVRILGFKLGLKKNELDI
jgi:N-acetylglucosaminyldiphosphoundecaprenol N-acetyl-beta-D-mannosaminyltransferase